MKKLMTLIIFSIFLLIVGTQAVYAQAVVPENPVHIFVPPPVMEIEDLFGLAGIDPLDIDGDGVPNEDDPCPLDPTDTCVPIPDPELFPCDGDMDGDGVTDYEDPCPNDPTDACMSVILDSDGDSWPDDIDVDPYDPGIY